MKLLIAKFGLLKTGAARHFCSRPICNQQFAILDSARLTSHSVFRRGWSLVEVMVVFVVMSVLISMTVPSFQRSLEQSRADIAGANLRALWSAERLYWLENRTYTSDLTELQSLGVLDPSIVSATSWYVYAITEADATSYTATATRTGSSVWTGQFSMAETGVLVGVVQASGEPDIVPGFQ